MKWSIHSIWDHPLNRVRLLKFAIGPWHLVKSQALFHYSQWKNSYKVEFAQDTLTGVHIGIVTEATIVTVDLPSQVYEGNRDSLSNSESPSPLPGGSYLDPKGDISLPASTDVSERQLIVSTAEAIQYTHSTELVDAIQDRDLRSLIAPPVTSLEEAMVISLAGTWSILSETREKHY